MGEVIHAAFGTEREWEATHKKLVDGLVAIGEAFGDHPDLMRAKAEAVMVVLRAIIEEVPTIQVTTTLPEGLCPEDREICTLAIKEATLRGLEVTMQHSVSVLMENIYDLCTSKLAARRS